MTMPDAIAWVGAGEAAIECQVTSAQIHHGRDDPTSQPEASSATLELVGAMPSEAVIGARVRVSAVLGGVEYPRFEGEITDVSVGWDTPDIARPTIIAVGDLGRTGRRVVGDAPWPAELDGARASRILTLAGFPPDPLVTDPGTVQILARDVDAQPALALAQEVASDGGGVIWQDRAGAIAYADALHRRGAVVGLTVDACDVGIGLAWEQSLEGLANDVRVSYGLPPVGGGDQPAVTASDPASIAARGTYEAKLTTQLATVTDAQRRADEIIARQSVPTWVLGGLELDLALLDHAHTVALLETLDMHELVAITGLPDTSPATSAALWVEGWRETIEGVPGGGLSWRVAYATSDYCRTSAPPNWDDLPPELTWNGLDPARTWNTALCIPPQPSRGGWDDAPATVRWDTLAPTVTWDTWPY
jgi:hypothetical protein